MPDLPITSVRLRLLPWRPRWRGGRDVGDGLDGLGWLDLDDPVSALLGLVVALVVLPLVVGLLLGVALLSLEMLALLPLGLLLLLGRLLHLRPWVLLVTYADGSRRQLEVVGLQRAWRQRRALLGRA